MNEQRSGKRVVWVNGELRPEGESHISPFDHGLLTGDGVFETLTTYGGKPFAWTRHDERLRRSAGALDLDVPGADTLLDAVERVIAANGLVEARIRITVTGGVGPLGSDRGGAPPTVIVAATEPKAFAETVAVATCPWPRNQRGALAGLKTISYGENVRALHHAKEHGAGEALFCDLDGNLSEGTGTNVFFVSEGRLVTPPLSTGCLNGVTRQLVVEVLGPSLSVPVVEEATTVDALRGADEAFLTSSTREAQAVSAVDGTVLPAAPGPVTREVQAAFADLVAGDLDP